MSRYVLAGPLAPFRGGIAHFTASTQAVLEARGHTVVPVTFSRQYPERLFPGKTQLEPESLQGDALQGPPRLVDTLDPRSWWRAARWAAEQRPDAFVFAHWMPFFAPAFGTIVRRLKARGVPSLALVHNAIPHERRPGDLALSRYVLKPCAGHLVLSQSVRRDLERLGVSAPIVQTPHPVYTQFGERVGRREAREALGLDPEAPVLLFFGFIRPYKGLDVLLDAMPTVLQAVPEVRLVVAGEFYAEEETIRAQAAPLGTAVRFDADYIPDERVGLYFSAADVVVQPYRTATQSGVAQIAIPFGVPLVTTDVGGLAETVPHEEAGLVVPPDNPEALSRALIRFFGDDLGPALREGVARLGERYTWDRVAEAIETLTPGP